MPCSIQLVISDQKNTRSLAYEITTSVCPAMMAHITLIRGMPNKGLHSRCSEVGSAAQTRQSADVSPHCNPRSEPSDAC